MSADRKILSHWRLEETEIKVHIPTRQATLLFTDNSLLSSIQYFSYLTAWSEWGGGTFLCISVWFIGIVNIKRKKGWRFPLLPGMPNINLSELSSSYWMYCVKIKLVLFLWYERLRGYRLVLAGQLEEGQWPPCQCSCRDLPASWPLLYYSQCVENYKLQCVFINTS